MKNFIQLVLLVAFSTVLTAQNTVTFQVDMNDYAGSFTTVYVSGDFNGWSGNANAMSDPNSDGVWEVSLPLTQDSIEFKYTLDNWAGQENLTAGTTCTKTSFGFTNRFLIISSNVTLPVNCFESCSACTGIVNTPPSLPLDWDDATITYGPISFGGIIDSIKADPTDPSNTVLKQDKGLGTQTWAGTTLLTNPSALPFTTGGANIMQVRFWSPDANVPVRLKVEDASNGAISVETEDTTTMAGAWEILTFDFNNEASGTAALNAANTYDKISLFPNFGTDGNTAGAKAYYIDDVVFGTLNTAMSGVYTIDPAGSGGRNYATFSAAAADLVSLGVSGPVTFNVAAGSYTDTVYLPAIMGTSATNTILFDGGDSATTSLAYNTAANNQRSVILMDGADYVTFKGLTITHSGTTDSWGIRMTNDNDYFTLDGCRIEMLPTTSTSELTCLGSSGSATSQYIETEAGDNITISNNTFVNGSFGVHFESDDPTSSTFTDSNIVVTNNVFQSNYYRYYMSDNTYMTTVSNNVCTGMTLSFGYGIALYDVIGFEINNNQVSVADYGIYISDGNFDGAPPATSNITNNMVISTGDEAFYANDFESANVYYNSFVVAGSSSTSAYGAYFNDCISVEVKNNVFYSESGYAAFFSDNTTTTSTTHGPIALDNNAYYTVSGANLAYDGGIYADLAAWQAARVGNNGSSVAGDPIFVNPASDLHVAGGLLNAAATPIASVTMDIDGDMRDATTPDIGADEYTPASCLPVSGFTTVMAYADSVTVSWLDPNGTGTTFNIEYDTAGFTPGTGTIITAHPDTFVTITGLTSNTAYEFYVTADCGTSGTATQAGPGSFRTTLAAPRALSCTSGTLGSLFTEEFDNATTFTGNVNAGNGSWVYDFNTTGSSNTGPSGPHSGTHYIYYEASSGPSVASMVSPAIDLSVAAQAVELTFWMHAYGSNIGVLDVGVSTSAAGPFTNLFSYGPGQLQSDELDPWQQVGINLDAYLGQTIYVEFTYTKGTIGTSFESDMAIDLVEVNSCLSCLNPSNLASSNISSTGADITWTSGSSNLGSTVEYGPAGFALGTGATATSNTGTVTLSGLMPATLYDVYVTDSCGAGDLSAAVGPINFTTLCPTSFTAPYSTDFEGISLGNLSSYENCWTTNTGGNPRWEAEDATTGFNENSSGTGPLQDNTLGSALGGHYMYLETSSPSSLGDTNVLYSPSIDISALTAPQIEFFYHMHGQTMGNLYVIAEDAAGTRVVLDSIIGQQQAAQSDAWLKKTIIPTTLSAGTYRFLFLGEAGSSFYSDMSIDDFSVSQAPTCFPPSALGVNTTTTTSAEVYWTPGNANNWLVQYGPAGFTPGTGTTISASNDTTTLSGLMAATAYDFWVADSCAPGDVSTFTGPFTFYTDVCAASAKCTYTLDLYDTFGDGWNGNEITVWQSGVPVGTYGGNFTSAVNGGDSLTGITLDLCDGLPTYVTLSTLGSWSQEIEFNLSNPLGALQGSHTATFGMAQGDTLVMFNTDCSACPALIAPFYESFDGTSTPACWTQYDNVGGPWFFSTNINSVQCASIPDNTGNGGNYAWMDQSGSDDSVCLEMPVIDISGLTTPYIEFYYAMCGTGYTPVNITIIENWDGSAWQVVDTLDFATNGWQKIEDTIPAGITYGSGLLKLRFRAESGGSSLDFYGDNGLDDIRIYEAPSCFTPSNLGATNITATSADVFWTTGGASNWIVEYGPAGFTPGTGSTMIATNDTVTLSGLMAATSYDFYVADSCGAGDVSLQSGPFNFNTACAPVLTAPYSNGFEGISFGNLASYENCWTTNVGSNPAWYSDAAGTSSGSTGPNVDNTLGTSAGTYMYLETSSPSSLGDTNVLYSPVFDWSGMTSPMLSFYYHMYGATMGNLRIWAEDASGVRTALDSIVGQQQTSGADAWLEKTILLTGLPAGNYRILFEGVAGSSFTSDMAIDDFSIIEAPQCFPSSNLSLVSAGNTSATVTWTAGQGTSWDVEYGPAGFTPGTGTVVNSTNDTLTITGLMALTAYDFYVTDSCGANGVATTAGPGSFTTAACPVADQCNYTFDLFDTFGDGWNGGEIKIYQNGVQVASLGSSFTGGNTSLGNLVSLCDNQPIVVTLDPAGSWPSEIGVIAIQPNGDTAGVHVASSSVGTGDTLFSFTSNCSACITYSAPFFESFEASSPSVACWTNETVSDTSLAWTIGTGSSGGAITSAYAGSNNAVYVSQGPSGAADTTRFVSPVIDLTSLLSPQLSFWYAQEDWFGDQNITNVYYRASASDPWTFLFGDNTNKSAWTLATMSLPNPSSTYQIAIEGINNWGRANVIDSLSITDAAVVCSMPDSVMAMNITATSADISWVSGTNASSSWIEYGPAGFTPGTGTVVNPATSASTLSGLMPGTLYEACVYDICSSLGDTSMAACVTFSTLCAPISSFPYLENFDNGVIPPCYSETATGSAYTWRVNSGGTPSGATGPSGDATTGAGFYMYVEASSPAAQGDSAFLWTAEFDMTSLTNPEVVYAYHMYGADIVNLDLQAYDRTSMTWVSLNNIVGQQQTSNGDAWLQARVSLASYSTDTALQLRFLSVRGASFNGDAAVDDIIIREIPPCIDPANLAVVTASSNSVTLSWDSDTNIVASTVQYGAPGFTLGTGTNVAATPNGFVVTGLAGTTCYDFYVKDSCSAGTNWIGPVTACTIATCSVSSVPSSTTNDTTDCDGGSTTLMATSSTSNDLAWIVNGIVRETGSTYITDSVSFTTAFDVSEYVTTSPALHVGPLTNIATSGFGNFSNGQWITVHDTVHIDSMTVRHQGDVVAYAQLWDASITNILQRGDTFSTPASITADMRVPVNMVVTPGVYFMNVDFLSGAGALFRATGGAQYPYDLAGLMSIDSTNFGSQVRIYYTFDMTVSKACIGAPAQALAVVPGANAGISDTSLVCSSDNAANMAAFLGVHDNGGTWVDNDATGANTDSILDATMLMSGTIYHFSYIVPGVNGCAGDTADVYIDVEAAPFGGVDTSAAYCAGSGIKILRNLLSGTAFGGTWVDVDGSGALNTGTGVFNSNNATAGTYRMQYILSGVACPADTTTITVTVDDPVSAGVAVTDTVCDDESMVDLNTFLDASATAGGMWTDLSGTGALSGNMFDATAVTNMSSYNFQYKVMSACGDDSITVSLYVDDCDVSVRELSTGFINIYPNPTTGLIKIDDENVRGSIKVEVFAGNGQLMISEEYAEGEEIRLDISEYAVGIYTVKVNSSKGLDVKRIMKQ